jgi:hypothetical protein
VRKKQRNEQGETRRKREKEKKKLRKTRCKNRTGEKSGPQISATFSPCFTFLPGYYGQLN